MTRSSLRQAAALMMILAMRSVSFAPLSFGGQPQVAPAVRGLEIRTAPRGYLIANEARAVGLNYAGTSSYYDLVLQTIYFINNSEGRLILEGGAIELLSGGLVLQQTAISTAEMARTQATASAIAGMKFPTALQALYSAGSILPAGVGVSPTLTLEKGAAGLVDDYYLIARFLPDQVRITARARDGAGREVASVLTMPVRVYKSSNAYILPLEPGEWYVLGFPGLLGHHRWTASTEHAFDFTIVDSRGSWARGATDDWRTGNVANWKDWYAYNKKVLAAAAGTVVKVVDNVEFPLDFWNRRKGESLANYRARINKKQMELFMAPGADPIAVAGGNHIVIRHEGDEYSFYAHLAYGTIRVKEGQRVVQGEHIAGVGGTGEFPAVHLHFQVSDGPSMETSRTLPVQFTNIRVNEQMVDVFEPRIVFQSGYFITAAAPAK